MQTHLIPASGRPSRSSEIVKDPLFRDLDGSEIIVKGGVWRLDVYAIYRQGSLRWIQLGIRGPRNYMFTLRLEPAIRPEQVIITVSRWLADPSAMREVVGVGPTPSVLLHPDPLGSIQ